MLCQSMYAFQSRNTAKRNAKPKTTAASIEPSICTGFANAVKETFTCQKTGPSVIVRINNTKHDQWFMYTQTQQDGRTSLRMH